MKNTRSVAQNLLAEATTRRADPKAIWGINWGQQGLNSLTGGVQREELGLLMARPGVGKTSWLEDRVIDISDWRETIDGQEYTAKYCADGVIRLVLLEMTAENFQQRLTCKRARVSVAKVRQGTLTDAQWERYVTAAQWVAKLPVEYLDNTNGLDMTARFLTAPNGRPTLWWALDYIQIHPTGQRGQAGDTQSINLISTTLRDIAKVVAPGLALSQMTREVDKREDKRPQMADLRGSGQLEADASLILGLYRADIYTRVPDEERNDPRPAELLLIKQRNGPTNRTINMIWHPQRMHFEDISGILPDEEAA